MSSGASPLVIGVAVICLIAMMALILFKLVRRQPTRTNDASPAANQRNDETITRTTGSDVPQFIGP